MIEQTLQEKKRKNFEGSSAIEGVLSCFLAWMTGLLEGKTDPVDAHRRPQRA
jgi:hypothetical protein